MLDLLTIDTGDVKFCNYTSYLRSSYHLAWKSCRVLCKTYCTTITFDRGTILLVGLVNCSTREVVCCLLHNRVSFEKLIIDAKTSVFKCSHLMEMNR